MKIKKEKRNLNRIKVVIETAKLNSVDEDDEENLEVESQEGQGGNDSSPSVSKSKLVGDNNHLGSSIKKHYILCQVPSLSKDLGSLSYNLDRLAAQVDGVASHGDTKVKTMKKELSSKIVEMMTVCDEFIKECGIE